MLPLQEHLLTPNQVRDTIGTAMYFGTYESVKQLLSNGRGNEPAEPGAVAFAGATCGIVSWVLVRSLLHVLMLLALIVSQIYPIDVVKTVYQKHQLAAGHSQVTRPKIRFFQMGSYRGKRTTQHLTDINSQKNRSGCQCHALSADQHDLLFFFRAIEETDQCDGGDLSLRFMSIYEQGVGLGRNKWVLTHGCIWGGVVGVFSLMAFSLFFHFSETYKPTYASNVDCTIYDDTREER